MEIKQYVYLFMAIISFYSIFIVGMEGPPPVLTTSSHNPSLNTQPPSLFPPLSHTNSNRPILGFEIKDLSQLAPIAIAMYCFNEFPRFTMISLSLMLVYTIAAKEIFKNHKTGLIARFKKICKRICCSLIKSLRKNRSIH